MYLQYAYNQMSYMLVRLLQTFSEMSLDLASIPPEAAPPAFWTNSPGRKATEKVWPKLHLTLYVNVRFESLTLTTVLLLIS